jgi:hypothetical protein
MWQRFEVSRRLKAPTFGWLASPLRILGNSASVPNADPAHLAARGRPLRRHLAHPGAGLLHGLPQQHLLQQRPVQRELLHGLGPPQRF